MRWLLAAVALAACSTGRAPSALPAFSPPPDPSGEVLLTVVAHEGEVAWDLASLEGLGTRDVEVFEPFLEHDTTFTVVPFADVLGRSGVVADDRVHLLALDDYTVDLTVTEIREGGVWLALRQEGESIALHDGGPIRVIFDDTAPTGRNEDHWIWSLVHAEVAE